MKSSASKPSLKKSGTAKLKPMMSSPNFFEAKSPKNKQAPSQALVQAMTLVKDFMTDSQKALILLREGKLYFDAGDIRGALECFSEGISFNPSVTLFNQRAACHKALEMYSEAYFDYSYNIRIEPEVGAHYCSRGLCLARLKKLSLALEDMDLAIHYDPSSAHYYARATVYGDFGKYEEALADYTSAIADDSSSTEFKLKCRYRRALTFFDMKQYEDVVKDANEILMLDVNNVPARALLGRAFKIMHEFQQAEEQLSNAILLDTNQASLYTENSLVERGDIRFRTGLRNKIIEAIYDFDKAVKILEGKLSPQSNYDSLVVSANYKILNRSGSMMNVHRPASRSLDFEQGIQNQQPFSSNGISHLERRDSNASLKSSNSIAILNKSHSSANVHRSDGLSTFLRKELEEQLGDTLYKRAQAKLMIEADPVNIEAALTDVMKAINHYSEDDDYYLVAATCYIRLQRYSDAMQILEGVLDRSPNNYKALYNLAFCRRAEGSQKDAIEGLTKIIAYSNNEMESFTSSSISVPIHRVFEMRGTLLHEVQAHKLALMDLGKAIAINPSQPANFYLRGDCQMKLGNYEQALQDFNSAEIKGFPDYCSLALSRGVVRRLLKDYEAAIRDFRLAYDHLDPMDRIGKIRILSFTAFTFIDLQQYNEAFKTLQQAQAFNSNLYSEKLTAHDQEQQQHSFGLEQDLLYCKRTEWILYYHMALCLYMLRSYEEAEHWIQLCLDISVRKFVPDDLSLGALYFYLGETLLYSSRFEEANQSFDDCFNTHWVDTAHNRFLATFAKAKALQALQAYPESIEFFTKALEMKPQNPYCHFRRAWSYKALGDFTKAGDDFETAKFYKPNDPNFAIDYKRISKCEYMEIYTEPDITEPFTALLPVPGLQLRA